MNYFTSVLLRKNTFKVLFVSLLLSCTAKAPSTMPVSAPKTIPGSTLPSLLPQETFFSSRQLNPSELALTGFRIQDLPLANGCSDGCLSHLNADLKWAAPSWQPQGATLTLASFEEPTAAPASFYNYYFNVLETAVNDQGIPYAIKVRMDVGIHLLDTQVVNQRSTGINSLIFTSIDGLNFTLEPQGVENGNMVYNWGKPNSTSFCEAGGFGQANGMLATSAVLTLNPTTQMGHLVTHYSGPIIYSYYNTELSGNPYSCALISNQTGAASANLDVSFVVNFAPNPGATPTPMATSTPQPTPTPNGTPTPGGTPSPVPTIVPGSGSCENETALANRINTLKNQLRPLIQDAGKILGIEIPFDLPNGGDFRTQSISDDILNIATNGINFAYDTTVQGLEAGLVTAKALKEQGLIKKTENEAQIQDLLERRKKLHESPVSKEVKQAINKEITNALNALNDKKREIDEALRTFEATILASEKVLEKLYALKAEIEDLTRQVTQCSLGGGGGPSSTPSPSPDNLLDCANDTIDALNSWKQSASPKLAKDLSNLIGNIESKKRDYVGSSVPNPNALFGFVAEGQVALNLRDNPNYDFVQRLGVDKEQWGVSDLKKSPTHTELDIVLGSGTNGTLGEVKTGKDGITGGAEAKFSVALQNNMQRVLYVLDRTEIDGNMKQTLSDKAAEAVDKEGNKVGYSNFNPDQDIKTLKEIVPDIDRCRNPK